MIHNVLPGEELSQRIVGFGPGGRPHGADVMCRETEIVIVGNHGNRTPDSMDMQTPRDLLTSS